MEIEAVNLLVPVSPWRLVGLAYLGEQAAEVPSAGECEATVVFGATGIRRAYEGTFRRHGRWLTVKLQRERRRRRRRWRLALGGASS